MNKKNEIIPLEKEEEKKDEIPVIINRIPLNNKEEKPKILKVLLITISVIISFFLVFAVPAIIKKTRTSVNVKKYEADANSGKLGTIEEIPESTDDVEFVKGFFSGNMIQGMESRNITGGIVASDSFGNIYIGGEGIIEVYDKNLNKKTPIAIRENTKISHINCVGNKLFFVVTGPNKLGLETSVAVSHDLGSRQTTTLNILKNNFKSTITSFAVTNENIFCTFLQGNKVSVYSSRGQAEKYSVKTTDSFTDSTLVLDADEKAIYYYTQGGIYTYNISKKKAEKIPSLELSPENRPFIYEGKVIYMSGKNIYCNLDKITDEKNEIENINIYRDSVLYNAGSTIMKYNLKTKEKEKIGEDNGITDFYVIDNRLLISLDEMKGLVLE